MHHFTFADPICRASRLLPALCLCGLAACAGGGGDGDVLPGDVLPDTVAADTAVDVLPGDVLPEAGPDLPPDTPLVEVDEDAEPDLPGEVTPEIEEDVGPCGGGCDDGDPCTVDECDPEVGCVNTPIEDCCPGQFPFELGFEGDDPLAGGVVEELVGGFPDAPELAPLTWQVVDDFAWSGGSSLYFGNPEMGNYHNDHRAAARFITAPLTLETGYAHTLSLQAWVDVEEGIWSDYLVVFVHTGGVDYPVWSKDDFNVSMGIWNQIIVDMTPFAGEEISVVFLFDSHDEVENFGGGVYLDDLSIERACEPLSCTGLSGCFTLSPCLDGQCVDGECVYTWEADCCLSPAECEDWDGCTLEFCDDFVCYSQPDPDPVCCNANEECADEDDVCTEDVCKNNVCTYLPTGEEGCCQADADCDDTDPCTKDLCTEQACVYVNLCCATDGDCDDGDDQCTDDQCIEGACYFLPTGADGCCVEELVNETFEDDATPDFLLESTLAGVGFEVTQGSAYSGAKAMIVDAVDPGESFTATATMTVAEIPPVAATLSFAVKLTMVSSGDCGQNELRVLVGDEVVWSGCATLNNYLPVTLDLSPYAGDAGPVAFVFEVNSTSGVGTWWAGVDSVLFSQDCCSADADCEDGNPCTADVCPGSNAVCQFPPIEGCCLTSAECDDEDICTEDVCTGDNVCEHFNLCCESDAECDDGDDVCTEDLCIGNFCEYIPSGAAGCCTPMTFLETFENGIDQWEVTGATGDFSWHASSAKAVSGDFSLAYSNSAGNDYNSGALATALSPPMDLPDQSGVSLVFQLWYEIENSFDDLDLYIVTDAGDVHLLGNWTGTAYDFWQEVSIDVTGWAGQTVQLRFEFSSDGSVTYQGVFIDDLSITQECCSDDAECDDGDPCTTDSCPGVDSLCAFIPVEGCCTTDEACGDGDPCTQDSCTSDQGGECLNVWICCETDDDCDDGEDLCTEDLCVDDYCQFLFTGAAGCCEPIIWEEGFEQGQGEWVFENQDTSPSWHLSTIKSSDGASSLAFTNGDGTSTGTYQDSTAISPPVELGVQPGVALGFQVWYDTEPGYDWCQVWVDHPGGEALLDEFSGHDDFWKEKSYSLEEWAGQEVTIRFQWHCDGSVSYTGIWFDEIAVTQGCCNADADCEDDNPCTEDVCPGLMSMCNNTWAEGCCLDEADCDDGDPCTWDICSETGGTCSHVTICCIADEDCDDGDDVCTDDTCVDNYCQFLPTGAAGCCEPEVWVEDFEGTLGAWEVDPPDGLYSWHVSDVKAYGGAKALHFGNAAGTDYGSNTDGDALSPVMSLPAGADVALHLAVWFDTESGYDYAKLFLVEMSSGVEVELDEFTGHAQGFWEDRSYDLAEWAGKDVRFKLLWHSDGSITYDGVWVDDMNVIQVCPGPE